MYAIRSYYERPAFFDDGFFTRLAKTSELRRLGDPGLSYNFV